MKTNKNRRTIGAWKLAHSPLHATAHPAELMTYRHNRLQGNAISTRLKEYRNN